MQPEQPSDPITPSDPREATGARWRTPLAFALAVPVGGAGGAFIWAAGVGSLCALAGFAPLAAAGLCALAAGKRVAVGLVMCAATACSLVGQSMAFDAAIGRPFDAGRHLGVFAFVFAATGVLSLLVSLPLARAERQEGANPPPP